MKHEETPNKLNNPRSVEPAPRAAQAQAQKPSWIKPMLLATCFIGLVGAGLGHMYGPPSGDHLSEQEKATIAGDFAKIRAVRLTPVTAAEWSGALDTMKLTPQARSELEKNLSPSAVTKQANNSSRLVWLELRDFASEDGDVVQIASEGYQIEIALFNAPTRIAVPVGAQGMLTIRGIHDGGGGITAALKSWDRPIPLPLMQEGQTLSVPVF